MHAGRSRLTCGMAARDQSAVMTDASSRDLQHAAHLAPDTVVVSAGRPPRDHDAPVNPPVVLSSTFFGRGEVVHGDRAYGRYSNPTWDPFEETLAELEGAALPGLVFASGLAAVSAALSLIPSGGVLVMPRHSYQGSLAMAAATGRAGRTAAAHRGHRGHRCRDGAAGRRRHAVAGKPDQPDARDRRGGGAGRRRAPGRRTGGRRTIPFPPRWGSVRWRRGSTSWCIR